MKTIKANRKSDDFFASLNAVAATNPRIKPKKVTIPTNTKVFISICLKSGSEAIALKLANPTFVQTPVIFLIPTSLNDIRAN
jgi:hypothetical protein